MGRCSTCGNDYDKSFDVRTSNGRTLTFDSLECAAHALAPACAQCGCRVLGHGVEEAGKVYCCASCARQVSGRTTLRDRAEQH